MLTTFVNSDGTIRLGPEAERAGYVPGTAVRVLVTRAGSLIVSVDDAAPLDVPYRVLPPARPALASDRRAG
jgi:hypothetical protein